MAVTQLDELSVKFTADLAGFKSQLEKIEVAVLKVAATTDRATTRMSKAFSTFGRFLSTGAIIGGISALLRLEGALEADADALDDVAKRANIGVEALQRLRIVANENGASASAMDDALVKLQKSIGAAKSGSQELQQVFAALGLSKLITETASTEDAAYALADAISQVKDKSQAAYVITQLLGKQGDELVGVFGEGGEALRAYAAAVEQSRIRNEELNAKLAESYDKSKRFWEFLGVLGSYLAGAFVDVLEAAGRAINYLIEQWNAATKAVTDYLAAAARFAVPQLPGVAKSILDSSPKSAFVRGGQGLLEGQGALPAPNFGLNTTSPFFEGVNASLLQGVAGPKGGGGKGSRRNEAEEAAKRYAEVLSELEFQIEQLARTEEDAAFQQELRNQLSAAGVSLATKEGLAIQEKVRAITDLTAAGEAQAASWAVEAANANRAIAEMNEEIKRAADEWADFQDQAGDAVATAFADAIIYGEELEQVFARLLQQLAEMIFQKYVFDAISGATGGGIGDVIGSVLGRAGGGPANRGTPYMVGEHGPELFVPNMNGAVVPRGLGGGSSFSYAPTIYAPGADQSTIATMRTMLAHQKQDILSMMPKVIKESTARGRLH